MNSDAVVLPSTCISSSTVPDVSTGIMTGGKSPGMLADLVAVDLTHPSLHPPTDLLKSVVYAMSPQAVTDVWVHGRRIVQDRKLATLDQESLVAGVAALTRGWSAA